MCKVRHHHSKGLDKFEPFTKESRGQDNRGEKWEPFEIPHHLQEMEMEGALYAEIGRQQIIRHFAFWNACIILPGGYPLGIKV